jgi:hypothetical protein
MSGPVYGAKRWVDIPDKTRVEAPDGGIVTSAMAGGRISTVEIPPAEPVKDKQRWPRRPKVLGRER